ncbi:MAG TPA: hypothetical protein VK487_04705 [Candidatus Bathyarchaeia archaeon]|nr:hypothetical protein [Candidatus Bathyarchaeia archaeon]
MFVGEIIQGRNGRARVQKQPWAIKKLVDVLLGLLDSPGINGNQKLLGEVLTDIYGKAPGYDFTNWGRKKDGWFFPDQARVQRRIKDLSDHYKSSNAYGWTKDLAKEMAKISQPGKSSKVKQERKDTLEQEE